MPPLHLPYREWRRLRRRAYAAQQRDQSEVCGLFALSGGRRIFLAFVRNESERPGHFEFRWSQFRQARKQIRAAGGRYRGIFHSHPVSPPVPGPGDIRGACVNDFQLIYDVCGRDAKCWRIVRIGRRKRPIEVPLTIERSRP